MMTTETPPPGKIKDRTQTLALPTVPTVSNSENAEFHADDVFGDTHVGLVRHDNQDSFAYQLSDDQSMLFLLVADGIGGNERGDLASSFVAQMMLREFQRFQTGGTPDTDVALEFLRNSFALTHSALRNLNTNFNVQRPMGSTIATLLLIPGFALTAHAGDSRIYCLRDGELIQWTRDHSVVNDLLAKGVISPEQAKNHPMSHVISQSMGVTYEIQPDFQIFPRKAADRFLICSDGVMLHLSDNSIRNILLAADSPRKAVNYILSMSLRNGGADNITAICAFPK